MPKTTKKYRGYTVMLAPSLIYDIKEFALKTMSTRSQLMRKWVVEGFEREKMGNKNIS